jgi:hypothetical protein
VRRGTASLACNRSQHRVTQRRVVPAIRFTRPRRLLAKLRVSVSSCVLHVVMELLPKTAGWRMLAELPPPDEDAAWAAAAAALHVAHAAPLPKGGFGAHSDCRPVNVLVRNAGGAARGERRAAGTCASWTLTALAPMVGACTRPSCRRP